MHLRVRVRVRVRVRDAPLYHYIHTLLLILFLQLKPFPSPLRFHTNHDAWSNKVCESWVELAVDWLLKAHGARCDKRIVAEDNVKHAAVAKKKS